MKLPDSSIRTFITYARCATRARSSTRSRRGCARTCRALVDGARIIRDGKVYLRKQCPRHGAVGGADLRRRRLVPASLTYIKEGSVPLKHSTKVEEGCPKDCGLCPDHEQHSCLPIIEITNHCNLECPICIVQNRNNYHMTAAEFARHHRRADREGRHCSTRSTSRAASRRSTREFLEFLDLARRARRSRASRSRPTACASPATSTSAASWPGARST